MELIDLMLADLRRPDPTTEAFALCRARSMALLELSEDDMQRATAELGGRPLPERRLKPPK
jgi:hypothetical protein